MVCALLLLTAVWTARCAAQSADPRYLGHQSWSTEEGLPQSSVHAIAQTPDGYLWAATEGGLARFDGVSFKVFGRGTEPAFRSDDICCLLADAAGALWIGSSDGLLQLQSGRFRAYGVGEGLPSATVLSLAAAPGGAVLVETAGGWAQWSNGNFHATSQPDASALAGTHGTEWHYTAQSVTVAANGTLHTWRVGRELPARRIATVHIDRAGAAWIGMNHGLFLADADATTPFAVTALSGNSILSLFEDAEGNHWIGTETSGLHVLRRLAFRSEPALAGTAVTAVAQTSDGSIWIGSRDDGLRRLRDGVWTRPLADHALSSQVVLCLAAADHGSLWVGTPDGLNYVSGDAGTETPSIRRITSADGLPDDYIRSLAAAPDGSVWVGTRHGLVHLRRAGNHLSMETLTIADGLGGDLIGTLLFTPDGLWASTSGGPSRIGSNGKIANFNAESAATQIVTAMAQDGAGHLWAATQDGALSFFDGSRFLAVASFPGQVVAMLADDAGALWLRTNNGIRRAPLAALLACAGRGRCSLQDVGTNYGLADGLPSSELVPGSASAPWLMANGELWFPSRGGVAIADTQHLPFNQLAPPIVLQRLLIDDAAQPLNEGEPQLPFGHARLTIEYAGLSYVAPSQVRYRFLLEGFDTHWTDAGARRSATYTNLPPGTYTFRVQAMNGDGVWNRTGASLRFRVVPPFYRRWWFLALAALAVCGALAGLYLLRLRRLRLQFDAVLAERNRMAREIHDTLTQDFVGTSLQLDILHQQLKGGHLEKALEQVRRTRQLVTDGLEEARRSIWELRANHSQDSLPTRLTRLLQRDAFAAIAPRLRVGGAYRQLDPRIEREVLRIAQEALTNVAHHAKATETQLELLYLRDTAETLVLTVQDNGRGFSVADAAHKEGHFGLLGMKERAAQIDGTLDISSVPGEGTMVALRVPLGARQEGLHG